MAEPAQVPLWIDLAAVAFGAMQGGVFGARARDERNDFDILGVAVFALVLGLGGGIVRDVLLGQVPAALRDDTYLLVAVRRRASPGCSWPRSSAGCAGPSTRSTRRSSGCSWSSARSRRRTPGCPAGRSSCSATITGIGGGVLRDLLAQRPVQLVQRSTPYALVALLGAAAFVALDTVGAAPRIAAGACLVVVFAVRMLALAPRVAIAGAGGRRRQRSSRSKKAVTRAS